MPLLLIILIYLLPGLAISRIFSGRLRNNILFQIFLSFIAAPVIYTISGLFFRQSVVVFASLNLTLLILLECVRKLKRISIDSNQIFPETKIDKYLIIALAVFLLMNTIPRIGLITGRYPIGDDMRRLGKVVSIAESDRFPLFYHFPATRMTVYYYVAIGAGLLMRFSNNAIKADLSWFIHTTLWYLSMLYLTAITAGSIFTKRSSKLIFFLSATVFSGYEIYIALLRGISPIGSVRWTDLEWWTDWFTDTYNIHFQLSSAYTQYFWVPQHMFAGILGLLIFMFIRTSKKKNPVESVFIGLIFSSILGYSAFVFLPLAISYIIFEIIMVIKRRRGLRTLILNNLFVSLTFLLLSWDTINLFLGAEKSEWFEVRLNVFWFLTNTSLINKLINLVLTVPLLLTIELGGLFFVLFYTIRRLIRGEKDDLLYWHLCIFLPLVLMFFFRAADDNNISLRSTTPSLLGLSIMTGKLVEENILKKPILIIFYILLFLSLPTTIYMFSQRAVEQFSFGSQHLDPIYQEIDKRIPLESIVLTDTTNWNNISALSHRFTFKPLKHFDFTDREYSAKSGIINYLRFNSANDSEIRDFVGKIIQEHPHLKTYRYYLLTDNKLNLEIITQSANYKLYAL